MMTGKENLSEAGAKAQQSFIDMSQSKNAHFDCLAALENKYQSGGAPSLVENLELQRLLAAHDKNVLAFKTAILAVTDDAEKQILYQLMS
ncbi:MAG: hypothetical protein ACI9LO_001281 [Planctomycetota bacterium]|jgi:hypothetical protein